MKDMVVCGEHWKVQTFYYKKKFLGQCWHLCNVQVLGLHSSWAAGSHLSCHSIVRSLRMAAGGSSLRLVSASFKSENEQEKEATPIGIQHGLQGQEGGQAVKESGRDFPASLSAWSAPHASNTPTFRPGKPWVWGGGKFPGMPCDSKHFPPPRPTFSRAGAPNLQTTAPVLGRGQFGTRPLKWQARVCAQLHLHKLRSTNMHVKLHLCKQWLWASHTCASAHCSCKWSCVHPFLSPPTSPQNRKGWGPPSRAPGLVSCASWSQFSAGLGRGKLACVCVWERETMKRGGHRITFFFWMYSACLGWWDHSSFRV